LWPKCLEEVIRSIHFLFCNHLELKFRSSSAEVLFMVSSPDPLAELLAPLLAKDPQAVTQFVRKAAPSALRVVRQIMGSSYPDVADIVQESLLATLKALPNFQRQCSLLHFVCRVAALTAMNARRRVQLCHQITPPSEQIDEYADDGPSPLASTLAERRRAVFRRLLDELPAAQAEVLALHCVLGFSILETAQATGAPVNTVRGRLLTAKATLRAKVADDHELYDLLQGVS
jgi:RNA polymerase sigma-70 factor, ECF subfamily